MTEHSKSLPKAKPATAAKPATHGGQARVHACDGNELARGATPGGAASGTRSHTPTIAGRRQL